MKQATVHQEQLPALKKIEGQVKGIQRMIDDKRYCVDIITQIHSIIGALYKVENNIFRKHIDGCVVHALKGKSESEKEKKIDEIIDLIQRFRRSA
ncbi:MAG: metal-sensitive transcriptional regulator [Candidatus Omnitrophica bacterium]|nr:metal-sensitive transcriptional regulator [Candidatus Omnitrophota bacterium]MBU4458253.1 metal-sensitive transcriptional regulator [Candidatus Omnitrophota bacterium]